MSIRNLCILASTLLSFTGAELVSGNVSRIGMDDFDNDIHYGFIEITSGDGKSYHVVVDEDTGNLVTGDSVQIELEPWTAGQTEAMAVPDSIGVESWWKGSEVVVNSTAREEASISSRDGDRPILMIRVCLRTTCPSYSSDDKLRSAMVEVDKVTLESSYKRTGFPAAKVSVVTSVVDHDIKSYTKCDSRRAMDAAMAVLKKQGLNPSQYRHLAYFIPQEIPGCNFAGYAYVGGTVSCNRYNSAAVIAHELGHNIGMWHAAADWDDNGKQDSEYGDPASYMGDAYAFSPVNALQRKKMGWISDSQKVEVDGCSDTKVILRDLDLLTGAAGSKVIATINRAGSSGGGVYYLSYRANSRRRLKSKVSVHYHKFRNTQAVALMDTSLVCRGHSCKKSSGWVGQGSSGSFELTVEQMDQMSATVQVKGGCCRGSSCTTTTTTTANVVRMQVREVGGQGCLKSRGSNQLLEKSATSGCATFAFLGKEFKSVDVPGQCLDYFSGRGWGLWSCHRGHNQQFRQTGSKWCVGSNCVESATEITTTVQPSSTTLTTTTFSTTPTTTAVATTTTTTTTTPIVTTTTTTITTATTPARTTTTSTFTTTTFAPSTSVTVSSATTTTLPSKGIQSGDAVFLKTRSGTGNYIDIEGTSVRARWQSQGNWQAIIIEKKGGGEVHSGDTVYLKAHTGAHIDVVEDGAVQARWTGHGGWQAMTVQKRVGSGPILAHDIICLKAHTDKHLDVEDDLVRARWNDCGDWQAMSIEKEPVGALFSGDSIHLLAHTGNRLEVEGDMVGARWSEAGSWQTFRIENYGGRVISSGDAVFIQAHTGAFVHVQDATLLAQWSEIGDWQKFIIQKDGNGPIMPGDRIFLRAHTGKLVDVEGTAVQARYFDEGEWQSLTVEKSNARRLAEVSNAKAAIDEVREEHSNIVLV